MHRRVLGARRPPAAGGGDDADDGAGAAASAIAAAIALQLEASLDDQSSLNTVLYERAFRPPPLRDAAVAVLDPLAFPHGKLHHASRGPAAAAAAAAAADVGVDGASDGGVCALTFAPPPPLALLHANSSTGTARKVAYLRSGRTVVLGR